MRALTWNLFHGRSLPAAGRDLSREFALLLAGWDWDVALLQEVPPWWPRQLARSTGADHRMALTSRNAGIALRRRLAERWPDLMKSNGGGCNAILTREAIVEHDALRLRVWPERRVAQLARLGNGTCLANFHGSSRVDLAEAELSQLWERALTWAAGAPLILGGDLNLRAPEAPGAPKAPAGEIVHLARRDVDHIFAHGFGGSAGAELLDRHVTLGDEQVELSDHLPLIGVAAGAGT